MSMIINLIEKIYSNKENCRSKYIDELQSIIEENDFSDNESLESILIQLSEDLDFYVENPNNRNEDPSYFGDKKLKDMLFYFMLNLEKTKNPDGL